MARMYNEAAAASQVWARYISVKESGSSAE